MKKLTLTLTAAAAALITGLALSPAAQAGEALARSIDLY